MTIAIKVIGVLLIVMSVFLVIAVLMQSSKDHRLGSSIAGGAETFFGKQKGKSMDAMFNKLTTVIAIVFVVLVLVLYFIAPGASNNDNASNPNNPEKEEYTDASDSNLGLDEGAGETDNAGAGEADNAGAGEADQQ